MTMRSDRCCGRPVRIGRLCSALAGDEIAVRIVWMSMTPPPPPHHRHATATLKTDSLSSVLARMSKAHPNHASPFFRQTVHECHLASAPLFYCDRCSTPELLQGFEVGEGSVIRAKTSYPVTTAHAQNAEHMSEGGGWAGGLGEGKLRPPSL
jgi:hypothetical protein